MTLSKSYISLEPLYHLQGNRLVILASFVCILRTFTKEGLEYITNRRQKNKGRLVILLDDSSELLKSLKYRYV